MKGHFASKSRAFMLSLHNFSVDFVRGVKKESSRGLGVEDVFLRLFNRSPSFK